MTNYRGAGDNLLADAVRYKKLWHADRDEIARLTALTAELQRQLVASRLAGRLLRLEDFYGHIGLETVVQSDGMLDYRKLDLAIGDLLRRRPELSAIPPENVRGLEYNQGDGAKVNDLL